MFQEMGSFTSAPFKILYGIFYIKVSYYITSHDTQKSIEIVGFKIVLKYILLHDLCP